MADRALSTSRRAVLGAAASLPLLALPSPVRPERAEGDRGSTRGAHLFARRLARYRRLAARMKVEAETGFLWKANRRYDRDRAVLKARFGSWEAALETPEGQELGRAAFARVNGAEEAYYDRCTAPARRAAVLLCLTPVPDLPALLAKLRVLQDQHLDELEFAGRPVLEVLAEDVGRLLNRSARI